MALLGARYDMMEYVARVTNVFPGLLMKNVTFTLYLPLDGVDLE